MCAWASVDVISRVCMTPSLRVNEAGARERERGEAGQPRERPPEQTEQIGHVFISRGRKR